MLPVLSRVPRRLRRHLRSALPVILAVAVVTSAATSLGFFDRFENLGLDIFTNFQNGASVKFGDANAVSTTVNSSTSISAIAPAHAAGDVAITVTNPDGGSATFGSYTYVAALAITSISPSIGSTAGGTQVTINGTGFTSAATVTFGGVAGTSVNVVSATTLTVIAPAHAAGAVDVIVKVGSAQATSANRFTYQTPGQKRRAVKQH